jgi:hypothetical protein
MDETLHAPEEECEKTEIAASSNGFTASIILISDGFFTIGSEFAHRVSATA